MPMYAVQSLLEIIKKTLESGEDILISGFGKFYVKGKQKTKSRNPATGRGLMLEGEKVFWSKKKWFL